MANRAAVMRSSRVSALQQNLSAAGVRLASFLIAVEMLAVRFASGRLSRSGSTIEITGLGELRISRVGNLS